ncbi:MAG: T9SS type A sorting domain-containing protein [Porphyromonadaceae bacterium]|nr:T9SS type A sorting domain-containing protein [Porphyromonadaceae bacterium]
MKNILLKPMMTLALMVAMILTGAANMQAQSVNMSRYITLTVESGKEIRLNLLAASTDTPIRIVSGSNTQDITVGIDWYNGNTPSTFTVMAGSSAMTIYGDLAGFDCSSNETYLTAFDISNNTALTELYCYDNQLASIDVSLNTALTNLDCGDNKLTSIDVSNNTALTYLYCAGNQLASLDISKNTALTELYCSGNPFASIDVSKNKSLTHLYCGGNKLTSLDISNNKALIVLNCYVNQITSLDISKNTALVALNCYVNRLTTLDISNNKALEQLNCYGNNFSTTALDAIYCNLPNRNGKTMGRISPIYNSSSSDHTLVQATTAGNAVAKNWKVHYFENNAEITTTGNYVCNNTAIADVQAAVAVSLYPNPVKDLLYAEADGKVRSIRLYNIYGTEAASTAGTKQIDLSSLTAGVYAVCVETDKGISVQRVVKR